MSRQNRFASGGKKIILTFLLFLAAFSLAGAVKIKASTTDNATGWGWGGSDDGAGNKTGLGWISTNNTNTGGGVSYGLKIPTSDGAVTGYAWSENLGWIDFNPQDHCTTGAADATHYSTASCANKDGNTGGVSRSGNNLIGWARFVGIAQESAKNNSGGWQGWIHLNDTTGSKYGIIVDNATGKLSGNAWSDELGAIAFRGVTTTGTEYGVQIPLPPTVSLTPNTTLIDVKTSGFPQTVTLNWSSTDATTCDATSTNGTWNQANVGTAGNHNVTVPSGMNEQFTVTCHGLGGDKAATALISTVCYPQVCASQKCGKDTANPKFGVPNTSTCSTTPPSTCSTDGDCVPRSIDSWKEVAP